jgi:predicted transposase/invertase (TIGR01784 family)
MLEVEEHFAFNDLQQIHILDLTRIVREGNGLLSDWLRFINGEKKEDFMLVAERNEIINAAFEELKVISSDENNRRLYEGRLKQQRDMWARENDARLEAKLEIAQNLLDKGMPVNDVAEATGLEVDDILRLQQ